MFKLLSKKYVDTYTVIYDPMTRTFTHPKHFADEDAQFRYEHLIYQIEDAMRQDVNENKQAALKMETVPSTVEIHWKSGVFGYYKYSLTTSTTFVS